TWLSPEPRDDRLDEAYTSSYLSSIRLRKSSISLGEWYSNSNPSSRPAIARRFSTMEREYTKTLYRCVRIASAMHSHHGNIPRNELPLYVWQFTDFWGILELKIFYSA